MQGRFNATGMALVKRDTHGFTADFIKQTLIIGTIAIKNNQGIAFVKPQYRSYIMGAIIVQFDSSADIERYRYK